jgi:hypothetical protein
VDSQHEVFCGSVQLVQNRCNPSKAQTVRPKVPINFGQSCPSNAGFTGVLGGTKCCSHSVWPIAREQICGQADNGVTFMCTAKDVGGSKEVLWKLPEERQGLWRHMQLNDQIMAMLWQCEQPWVHLCGGCEARRSYRIAGHSQDIM